MIKLATLHEANMFVIQNLRFVYFFYSPPGPWGGYGGGYGSWGGGWGGEGYGGGGKMAGGGGFRGRGGRGGRNAPY